MIQDLKRPNIHSLDRAHLYDTFELCCAWAQAYARCHWRHVELLNLRSVINSYKTVSDDIHKDDEDKSPEAVLGRRRELVEEVVAKCLPHLNDKQVELLRAKLTEIVENDTPEKLEADIERWLHGSK